MSRVGRALRWSLPLALGLTAVATTPWAFAQPSTSGPSVTADMTSAKIGTTVSLTIEGFRTRSVTISFCGNEARRGSSDCNMIASEGRHLPADGEVSLAELPVAAPPVDCPCVIRVASRLNDEVAVIPFEIVGHPVGPLVDSPNVDTSVAVTIDAHRAPDGVAAWGRSSLGGAATYAVTVTVKNRSTVAVNDLRLSGAAERGSDHLATLVLDAPGVIAPGQTWEQEVRVTVPGPSFGDVRWRVAASGAGRVATAAKTTHDTPWLLLALLVFLVADLTVLLIRFRIRHRWRRDDESRLASAPTIIDVGSFDPVG